MLKPKDTRLKSFSFSLTREQFSLRESEALDFSEFTKSDRERSAEVLTNWRSLSGWQIAKPSHSRRASRVTLALLLVLQLTAVLLAFYVYLRS